MNFEASQQENNTKSGKNSVWRNEILLGFDSLNS